MTSKETARFVIVGGGAVGCGIAYALAKSGRTDVVVVEQRTRPAQGTTSQGAGLCGQVRTSVERTRLAMHSAKTFASLQAANAPARPGWREVGSLRLATTEPRVRELRRLAEISAAAGLEVELIDPARARRLWPVLNFSNVLAALWCPSDGYMVPALVAQTYEHYCREMGVRFLTETEVEAIDCPGGVVGEVRTNRGSIDCEYVINAAGPFAYRVARMVGLELPIVPVRHQYFVTEPLGGLDPSFPVLRIPETGLYARVDGNGLLLGGWEADCVSIVPRDRNGADADPPIEPDRKVLDTFAERFGAMLPEVVQAPRARVARGWPTFTPDGRFLLGESSQVPGFVMAGGCNAHGISGSPGLGETMLESLFSDRPSEYVRSLSPDRFQNVRWTWPEVQHSVESICRNYYEMVMFDADSTEPAEIERRFDGREPLPPEAPSHAVPRSLAKKS